MPDQLTILSQRADDFAAAPFFPAIMEDVEKSESVHRDYTAERLARHQPAKFQACVHYLAQGYGLLRIGKLVGVSHHTVSAVRDLHPASVAIEKERLAGLAKRGAELCLERIIEEVESLPKQTLGLTAAQLIDKFQLLTGGATARIGTERAKEVPTADDFNALIDSLPVVQAEVVATGLDGGKVGQIADTPDTGASDSKAPAFASDQPNATRTATLGQQLGGDREPGHDPDSKGGGGGRKIAGGLPDHTH